jgi:hypothetical protein
MTKKTFHIPYLSQFKKGLLWTFIDSFGSQGLVILFHLLFRTYAGIILHGVLGCTLSLIYLAVAIANIGLDSSLAPFLEIFSASKKRFWLLAYLVVIPQAFFLGIICVSFYLSISYIPYIPFFKALAPYFSSDFFNYGLLIFFLESMRKTFRTFLQLSFYFRFAALIELLGVVINILGIVALNRYQHLTLLTSLQVLLYASLFQSVALVGGLASWYSTLSNREATTVHRLELFIRITKTRFFTWILNCLHQLYSGNFLVPVCAFQFGIESASLMKVISSISYWITLVAKKSLGITSNALLAHLKSRSLETQAHAFHFLTEVFNQILYGLFIFLLVNGRKIALLQGAQGEPITWALLYGMVILTFLESLFVLYEKWYILEEDVHTYLGFNLISIGLLYLSIQSLQSPVAIVLTIIGMRVATFILLSLFSFYRWNIWPSLKPHRRMLIVACAIAGIGYIVL